MFKNKHNPDIKNKYSKEDNFRKEKKNDIKPQNKPYKLIIKDEKNIKKNIKEAKDLLLTTMEESNEEVKLRLDDEMKFRLESEQERIKKKKQYDKEEKERKEREEEAERLEKQKSRERIEAEIQNEINQLEVKDMQEEKLKKLMKKKENKDKRRRKRKKAKAQFVLNNIDEDIEVTDFIDMKGDALSSYNKEIEADKERLKDIENLLDF